MGFFQFEIIKNVLVIVFSDSFEYLCYGSTAIRKKFYSYSVGIDFSQNLMSTVYPRAGRVNNWGFHGCFQISCEHRLQGSYEA